MWHIRRVRMLAMGLLDRTRWRTICKKDEIEHIKSKALP